jgi:hypothetical protein
MGLLIKRNVEFSGWEDPKIKVGWSAKTRRLGFLRGPTWLGHTPIVGGQIVWQSLRKEATGRKRLGRSKSTSYTYEQD